MNHERDPLLDEIGRALSIDPAPAFVARVRAEVVATRVKSPWRAHCLVAVPAALALTIAGGVWLHRQAGPARPAPVSAVTTAETFAGTTPEAAVLTPPPSLARVRPSRTASVQRGKVREADVLVPPDRAEGLRWWIEYVREGRAVPPPGPRVADVSGQAGELPPLPEITRIDVPALTIDPLPGAETQNTGVLDD